MPDNKACAAGQHEWIVWGDGPDPIAEDLAEDEAEALIEQNKEEYYAECNRCGRTINA